MRVLSLFVAIVLAVLAITQLVSAQSAKSICLPIIVGNATVNPNVIPSVIITNMTNRGVGSYTMGVSLCTAAVAPAVFKACGNVTGYVAIANATACLGAFDKPLMRPTADKDGFKVKYGSTSSPKDDFEATVLCNPFSSSDALQSRSGKFAGMTPNKLGGTTWMAVFFSHVACGSNATQVPMPTIPTGTSSILPPSSDSGSGETPIPNSMSGSGSMSSQSPSSGSGGSMPSGGSGSMPSGGSGGSGGSMPSAI